MSLIIKTNNDAAMREHLKDLHEYVRDFMASTKISISIEPGIDNYVQIKLKRDNKTAAFIMDRDELLSMPVNEIGDRIFEMQKDVWRFLMHYGSTY